MHGLYNPPPPRLIRAVMLIDGDFLQRVIEDNFPGKQIAIRPFLATLSDVFNDGQSKPDCVRTYFYDALVEDTLNLPDEKIDEARKKAAFLDYLEEKCERVDVKLGFVRVPGKPGRELEQKAVDTMLATDMALMAWSGKVEAIILVAGDADFVPAVEVAKQAMVTTFLISDPKKLNILLKKAADVYRVNLTNIIETSGCLYDPSAFDDAGGFPSKLTRIHPTRK